jgi:hypothetical protein
VKISPVKEYYSKHEKVHLYNKQGSCWNGQAAKVIKDKGDKIKIDYTDKDFKQNSRDYKYEGKDKGSFMKIRCVKSMEEADH